MEWPCPEPFISAISRTAGSSFSPCCTANSAALLKHVLENLPADLKDAYPEAAAEIPTALAALAQELSLDAIRQDFTVPEKYRSFVNSLYGSTYSEFFSSPISLTLKEAFINNDEKLLNKVCESCKQKEASGVESYRQSHLKYYDLTDFKQAVSNYKEVPSSIEHIDLTGMVGNVCNLACHMCHPVASSKYKSESITLKEIPITKAVQQPRLNEDYYNDLVNNILPKARKIKFAGGEPTMSKNLFRLLERLPDSLKSTLDVQMSTNLTNTKNLSRMLDLLRPFKYIKIHVSIEGVGPVQEYIRYPSKWSDIVDHCKILKAESNIDVIFATTINALNIGYNYQVVDEYKKHVNGVSFGSLVTNNFYSIQSVPPDIRKIYINNLYSHYRKNHEIPGMIGLLETVEYKENEMWAMLAHIKRRDDHRKTNLLNIFPEWEPYYTKL